MKNKYVVFSTDPDEEQFFVDMVATDESAATAEEIVSRMRPYAVMPNKAYTSAQLRELADKLDAEPQDFILPFMEEVKGLSREDCVKILTRFGFECYDREDEGCLREAVRANLEDDTIKLEDLEELE